MSKTYIVTGASRGIGWAVAEYLLQHPDNVNVIGVARDPSPLQKLKDQYPNRMEYMSADLSDLTMARKVVAFSLASFGRLDGVVFNHGRLEPVAKIVEADVEAWKEGFDANFFSAIALLKMAIPQLRLTRGRIVFTSSGAATSGTTGWGFYGASKAALNHLNMTIAKEEQDIVTVAIRPGMVDTQMQEDLRSYHTETLGPKEAERFIEAHKQGKLLRPEQPGYVIAKLILGATRDLSGKFMTWNDTDLAKFQAD